MVVEDAGTDTRTHKIFHAIDEICTKFDLGHPIWLDSTVRDFQLHSKTRFTHGQFHREPFPSITSKYRSSKKTEVPVFADYRGGDRLRGLADYEGKLHSRHKKRMLHPLFLCINFSS